MTATGAGRSLHGQAVCDRRPAFNYLRYAQHGLDLLREHGYEGEFAMLELKALSPGQ